MSDMQAATHLKGLADKAKLNEKHEDRLDL